MRRLGAQLVAVAMLWLVVAAPAGAAPHLNAYSIEGNFMCTGCHEPLNQVNSAEAQGEKDALNQLVAAGLNISQIKAQMVRDYGEEVLAKPPAHGISLLVYILPPLVLVGGIALLAYNLPRWRRRAKVEAAQGAGPIGPPTNQADVERLDRELAEFDR